MKSYSWILLAAVGVLAGCGGGGSKSTSTPGNNPIAPAGSNVQTINAGGGSFNPANIVNGAFASATICSPGTSSCATIDGLLVDTGSTGLRVLASVLPSGFTLPKQMDSSGNPIAECFEFVDSVTWGPIEMADMKIASEQASSIPIQVIADPGFPLPASCNSGPSANDVNSLGANGILGIGNLLQDCGSACTVAEPTPIYFSCPASGCVGITQALNSQVQHPVAHFATDNNGVIIELPAVSSTGAVSNTGSLVFGIGTQSNNTLGSATVLTLDQTGAFTTDFQGQSFSGSFVDSGSNGLFFLDNATTKIPICTVNTDFYCPASSQALAATNVGMNGKMTGINFSIANGDTLLAQTNPNFLFSNLGGPNPNIFDWGLPFFYGRNVFIAIEGQSTPGGTGPYTAY